ncbi:MAG: ribosomal protein S18-alanine N-acetyltransferase [Candidatus Firestonebacteria bacterium]
MIEIDRMKESDLNEVFNIEVCSPDPWKYNMFLREVKDNPNSIFLVGRENGKIVGYGGFWKIMDEINIVNLAVHPSFRKKRIGSQILTEMLKISKEKGAKFATLEVSQSNISAQKLYKKFGFKIIAIRKKYYQDSNEDAIVMWLNPV